MKSQFLNVKFISETTISKDWMMESNTYKIKFIHRKIHTQLKKICSQKCSIYIQHQVHSYTLNKIVLIDLAAKVIFVETDTYAGSRVGFLHGPGHGSKGEPASNGLKKEGHQLQLQLRYSSRWKPRRPGHSRKAGTYETPKCMGGS